jgi:2'-5' RNA ligase
VALAAIAVPRFAAADGQLVGALRAGHDPQAARVPPHITLVFPTTSLGADALAAHVAAAAAGVARIAIVLREARAVADPVAGGWDVQLLPHEGAAAIRALHARLYTGVLLADLRRDLPYEPHVTVAKLADAAAAERLAARVGPIAIAGRIDAVEILRLEAAGAATIALVALAPP